MKATLTAAALLAIAASLPARAGEGAGDPFPFSTPSAPTQMTVKRGGNTDPYQWSAAPTASQMAVKRGGNTDPFQWSSTPMQPDASRHAADTATRRNPG